MRAETLRSTLGLILIMLLCYFLQSAVFSRLHIFQISAGNYPDIIYGEIPDYSGMTITAYYFNGSFSVPPQLCEFTVEYSGNYAEITVYFAGCTANHLSGFTYALYTAGGRKLLTTDEKILTVKELN